MPFDPSKNFAQIIGPGRARYFQDGHEYDGDGRVISQWEPVPIDAPMAEEEKQDSPVIEEQANSVLLDSQDKPKKRGRPRKEPAL